MKVFNDNELSLEESIISIGTFDGMHRGHQALIKQAATRAQEIGIPSVVYTFDPPPRSHFQYTRILTQIDEKIDLIRQLGVDYTVVANFTNDYASRPASLFVDELISLGAKETWVGPYFQFGKGKKGNIYMLTKHFHVPIQPFITCEKGEIISSTRIRELLIVGDWKQVYHLLGRRRLETLIYEVI